MLGNRAMNSRSSRSGVLSSGFPPWIRGSSCNPTLTSGFVARGWLLNGITHSQPPWKMWCRVPSLHLSGVPWMPAGTVSSYGVTSIMWVKIDREWCRSRVGSSRSPSLVASGARKPLASTTKRLRHVAPVCAVTVTPSSAGSTSTIRACWITFAPYFTATESSHASRSCRK